MQVVRCMLFFICTFCSALCFQSPSHWIGNLVHSRRNTIISHNRALKKLDMSVDYIKISAPGREREQKIPASLVSSFGKWIVSNGNLQPITENDGSGKGWVDPISFDEVWLPLDLPAPQQRPAVAVLIKDGAIRCIMPALDISVHASGETWWNRGMCSFPLAHVWMDLKSTDVTKLVLTAYSQASFLSMHIV